MTSTQFKLSKRDDVTRRITFPNEPAWASLAAKIESLYGIPIDKIGVSYVDSDGDEVTLSSQEELQDFYQLSHQPSQAIKFVVQDLSSTRSESKALPQVPHSANVRNIFGDLRRTRSDGKDLPQTPPSANVRNTFGNEGLLFDIEDDWQRVPTVQGFEGLFLPRTPRPESPHAFVEVVESDTSSISKENEDTEDESDDHSTVQTDFGHLTTHSPGKGKGKAHEDMPPSISNAISSTGSVIAEDAPPKPPVHVYDLSPNDEGDGGLFDFALTPAAESPRSTVLPIPAESTPKAVVQTLNAAEAESPESPIPSEAAATALPEETAPDPPLPSLDSPHVEHATPSLSNDVASLLYMLTNIVTLHPELSEGFRNIIRNTSNGTYWTAHREAISRAAEELSQNTGQSVEAIHRSAEDEAGSRVADALGGIFRTLSQVTNGIIANVPPALSSDTASAVPAESGHPWPTDSPPQPYNSASFWYGYRPPQGYRGHPPHPPHLFGNPWSRAHHSYGGPRTGPWGTPWNNPPHHGGRDGPPRPPGPPPPHSNPPGNGPPPPPPPPGPPPMHGGSGSEPFGSWSAPDANPPVSRPKPTPQELRAHVEAAKLLYKAEKDRYRQEREERRKEKERKMSLVGETLVFHLHFILLVH